MTWIWSKSPSKLWILWFMHNINRFGEIFRLKQKSLFWVRVSLGNAVTAGRGSRWQDEESKALGGRGSGSDWKGVVVRGAQNQPHNYTMFTNKLLFKSHLFINIDIPEGIFFHHHSSYWSSKSANDTTFWTMPVDILVCHAWTSPVLNPAAADR